ncbi:hypothetical protein [Mucisphaera calidilacus]|uniref:hypothetical protein n=1 Tax=Mucisphaera calidilacus TaxID=2527982 RepID=UPI001F32AB96|nr:hypothetical protein [Mucisphaera calidilacus]
MKKRSSKQQQAKQPARKKSRLQLEALEPRVLLTTLFGGDTFVYTDANDNNVEVQIEGDVIVELIAAQYNPAIDGFEIGNLPGLLLADGGGLNSPIIGRTSSSITVFNDDGAAVNNVYGAINGGLNGTIGSTFWTDISSFIIPDTITGVTVPEDDALEYQSIATNAAGDTYGFLVLPRTYVDANGEEFEQNEIFVVRLDSTEGGTTHELIASLSNLQGGLGSGGPDAIGPLYNLELDADTNAADWEPLVRAADFNPGDGLLYFVVEAEDPTIGSPIDKLFAYDVENDVTFPVVDLEGSPADPADPAPLFPPSEEQFISSMAFEVTGQEDGNNTYRMVFWIDVDDEEIGGQLAWVDVTEDPTDDLRNTIATQASDSANFSFSGALVDPATVREDDPTNITGVTGIEFFGDNTLNTEQFLYIVDGDNALLYQVDMTDTSQVRTMGVTTDGDPDEPNGENLAGMAYDANTLNPFTGTPGVFFATDTETDNLVILDHRFRPSTEAGAGADLFMIYVTKGDSENGRIRIAMRNDDIFVTGNEDPRSLTPYGGEAYEWSAALTDGTPTITPPGGSGGVLIGAVDDPDSDIPVNVLDPVYVGNLPEGRNEVPDFVTYPYLFDTHVNLNQGTPEDEGPDVAPGVQISASLWDYYSGSLLGSLMGNNIDVVTEAAISADGTRLALIDSDGVDALGRTVDENGDFIGDELFVFNLSTLQLEQSTRIFSNASGSRATLSNIQGLDFGDFDSDGVDELYAIYNAGGSASVGVLQVGSNGLFTGEFIANAAISRAPGSPPATNTAPAADDIRITLRDGTNIDVDLDQLPDLTTVTLQQLIDVINDDPDNLANPDANIGGKLLEVRGNNTLLSDFKVGNFTHLEFIDRSSLFYMIDNGSSTLASALGLDKVDGSDRINENQLPDGTLSAGLAFEDIYARLHDDTVLHDIQDAQGESLFTAAGVNTLLSNGAGVVDFTIETRDGNTFEVDLDGAAFAALDDTSTLDDFITALGTVQDTTATTDIATALNFAVTGRLQITDTTVFDDNSIFRVVIANDSTAMALLGLTSTNAEDSTGSTTRIDGNTVDNITGNLAISLDTPIDALLDRNLNPVDVTDADITLKGQDGAPQNYTFVAGNTLQTIIDDLAPDDFTLNIAPGTAVTLDDGNAAGTTMQLSDQAGSSFFSQLFFGTNETGTAAIDDDSAPDVAGSNPGIIRPDDFFSTGQTITPAAQLSAIWASEITGRVQAFAIDPITQHGFAIDDGSVDGTSLIEFNLITGAAIRSGLLPDQLDGADTTARFGTMDFTSDGNLRAHDVATGSLITIDTTNFRSGLLSAANIPFTGNQRIAIDLQDGTTDFFVDLTGANDFQGIINRIQSATNGNVSVTLGGANSLILTDNTAGGGTFAIRNAAGTNAATLLGINTVDNGGGDLRADVGIIQGQPNFTAVNIDPTLSTVSGSIGPDIGAITFNNATSEFLGLNNALSVHRLLNEAGSNESAALVRLAGFEAGDAEGQDLRDLFIGGTLTGVFYGTGSIETLYVGWAITGDATGKNTGLFTNTLDHDFILLGDVRDLIFSSSVGGSDALETTFNVTPLLTTGTDISVGGTIGRLMVARPGSGLYADVTVLNPVEFNDGIDYDDLPYSEIEGNNDPNITDRITQKWSLPEIEPYATLYAGDGRFSNDSFETAEPLGALRNGGIDGSEALTVRGTLYSGINDDDHVDYYSLGLLAGQTITLDLVPVLDIDFNPFRVGIFDPDGRLVATNYAHVDKVRKASDFFEFTADIPGEYRFAVGVFTNPLFEDGGDTITAEYNLDIFGVGNMGLGGVVATNIANNIISVAQGDIGAVRADTNQIANVGFLAGRNIRSIDAADDIGYREGEDIVDFSIIVQAGGDVGLIRQQLGIGEGTMQIGSLFAGGDVQMIEAGGIFIGNLSIDGGLGVLRAGGINGSDTAGGDYEGPISNIRVNADNSLDGDGIIDLIDVAGDLGSSAQAPNNTVVIGGPSISTGPDGNVRYMRVGGLIYQNNDFGAGQFGEFRLDAGEGATIVDDSGATVRIAPVDTGEVVTNEDGTTPDEDDPVAFLTYRTFAIADGGSVLVDIHSSGGVSIVGNSLGTGAPVEIGAIYANGQGRAVTINEEEGFAELPELEVFEEEIDLYVSIGGGHNNPVHVYYVGTDGDDNGTSETRGQFSAITNNTGGEIVNIEAATIGTLSVDGVVGYGLSYATDSAVRGFLLTQDIIANENIATVVTAPRTGVVSGSIENVRTDTALGNFFVSGIVTSVRADADGIDDPNLFEGVNGAFIVIDDSGLEILNGNIFSFDVGEGISSSGSGQFAEAGIFAIGRIDGGSLIIGTGAIGSITGRDAAIYGDIYADISIQNISLTGDSVISGGDILVTAGSAATLQLLDPLVLIDGGLASGLSINDPDPDAVALGERQRVGLNNINVNGTGGIIGAFIGGPLIGNITVNNGFGIFNSVVASPGTEGTINNLNIDGYGLRGTYVTSKGDINNILVNGRGEQLAVTDFSVHARSSESVGVDPATGIAFDPATGLPIDRYNDLHRFLGTDATTPGTSDLDNAGVIDSAVIQTAGNLTGQIRAYQIASTYDPSDEHPFNDQILSDTLGNALPAYTYINVAGKLNKLILTSTAANLQDHHNINTVAGQSLGIDPFTSLPTELADVSIAGLSITAGELGTFTPGANVVGLDLTVDGLIRNLNFKGDLLSLTELDPILTSSIEARGPGGQITNLTVAGDMQADIFATNYINRVTIDGDLTGTITVLRGDLRGRGLGTLTLGGDLIDGGLDIEGDVNAIRIDGSVGNPRNAFDEIADQLLITGNLGTFQSGQRVDGANMALDLVVLGDMRTLDVSGMFTGELFVGGDLGSFRVAADAVTRGTTIIGSEFGDVDVNVSGTIGSVTVSNGHVGDGELDTNNDAVLERVRINAGEGIRNFSVTNGSVLADAQVASALGDINAITVRGGDFHGRVDANAGTVRNLRLSGSDFGGSLNALELSSFTIDGSLLTGATIDVDEAGRISIGQDIQAGVVVTLGSAQSLTVRNDLNGTLLVEGTSSRLNLTVSNDVTGQVFLGADANIRIGGDLDSSTPITVDTTLAELGIVGSPGSSIEVQLRDGTAPRVVDLTGVSTIAELKAAIEAEVPFVIVSIDDDQEAIRLTDESPDNGATFSVTDLGNGTIARTLGFNTADGGAGDRDNNANGTIEGAPIGFGLVQGTSLEDLGADIAPDSDLRFTLSDGSSLSVSLAGAESLQDIIDAINAVSINLTAGLDPTGTALQVTDATGNGLQIQNGVDSRMAERLGLLATDGALGDNDGALDGTITGSRLSGALLYIDGDASNLSIDSVNGGVFVTGELRSLNANSIDASVIVTGQDLGRINVRNDISNTLVQAGLLPTASIEQVALQIRQDLPGQAVVLYNPVDGTDASRGEIGSLSAVNLTESVIAAGGEFGTLRLRGGMTDSSVSSGIVFGVTAVNDAARDATTLGTAAERNDARGTAGDRVLTQGDFGSATISGSVATSAITAGIDPGDDGIFDANATSLVGAPAANDSNIYSSTTGGQSAIGTLNAGAWDGASLGLSDGPISRTNLPGGQQGIFDYTIEAIDGAAGSPVAALPVTVIAPNADGTITVPGATGSLIVRPAGGATVVVYDDNAADDTIDAIVITGGARNASLTITGDGANDPADWAIERILADDDASLATLRFDGLLTGDDATGTVDLWLESGLSTLVLGGFAETTANGLTGRIAGDIRTADLGTVGGGNLTIGGEVSRLTLGGSENSPVLGNAAESASPGITEITFTNTGLFYSFDGNTGLFQSSDTTDVATFAIADNGPSTIAADLGIAGTDGAAGDTDNTDNNAILGTQLSADPITLDTTLADLGIDPTGGNVDFAFRDGNTATIDLSAATTLRDVASILTADSEGRLYTTLTDDGELRIVETSTTTRVSIDDTLASGVEINPGETLTISLRDGGDDLTINLSNVYTLQDLIDAVNTQSFRFFTDLGGTPYRDAEGNRVLDTTTGPLVTARINDEGNGLVFEDQTAGGNTFQINVDDPDSDLITIFGLDATDGGVGEGASDGNLMTGSILLTEAIKTDLRDVLGSAAGNTFDPTNTLRLSIDLRDGSNGVIVDLTGLSTFEDVAQAIYDQTDQRVTLVTAGGARMVAIDNSTDNGGTFAIADAVGDLAEKLGIAAVDDGADPNDQDGAPNGRILGRGLVTLETQLSVLGVAVNGDEVLSFDLAGADPARTGFTVNLVNFTVNTVGDLINAIETVAGNFPVVGNGLTVEIVNTDFDGSYLVVSDNGGSSALRITDVEGTIAQDLGISGFDGGPTDDDGAADGTFSSINLFIRTATLADSSVSFAGDQVLDLALDGGVATATLSDVDTLAGVINAFEADDNVRAGFDGLGRLVLIDTTGDGGFTITQTSGDAAVALGLLPTDGLAGVADGVINTLPITPVVTENTSLLGGLGINFQDELAITVQLRDSSVFSIDLSEARTAEQVLDAISRATSGLVSAEFGAGGRIILTDSSIGAASFSISDTSGVIAQRLGIAATDGLVNDVDGVVDGVILGRSIIQTSTRLSMLGIDPANGIVDVDYRDGTSSTIDLSGARSVADVAATLAADSSGRLSVTITTDGRLLVTDGSSGGGTFAIADNNIFSTIARDLGIDQTDDGSDNDGVANKQILGNRLIASQATLPAALGAGQTLRLNLQSGATVDVDLSNANTFGEIIHKINIDAAGLVSARLASDARLVITDLTAGGNVFSIADQAGTPATTLGIAATDGGAGDQDGELAADGTIKGTSLYGDNAAAVNLFDLGISFVAGDAFTITTADNVTTVINVAAATTLDDLITAIETAPNVSVTVGLDGGLNVEDTSGGATVPFRIYTDAGQSSNALEQIGLEASDGGAGDLDGSSDNTITGTSIVTAATRMSLLGIAATGAEELVLTLHDGSTRVVDLTDTTTIGEVIEAIQTQTANDVTVVIDQAGRLLLTDTTADAGGAFTINNLAGTPATDLGILTTQATRLADALGIAGTDGTDADGAANGTLLGPAILTDAFTLDALGINPANGAIDVTLQDGTTVTIDLAAATSIEDVSDAIAAATSGNLTLLVTTEGRLQLTDATAGGSTLTIADNGSSTIAADLGIAATDGGPGDDDAIANGVIVGDNILADALTLQALGLEANGAGVNVTLQDATAANVDLSAAASVDDVATALAAGTAGNLSLVITPDGRLQLTDATAGGSTLRVSDDAVLGNNLVTKLVAEDALSTVDGTTIDTGIDLRISLSDEGDALNINLVGAETLQDVADLINQQAVRYEIDADGTRTITESGLVTASINDNGQLVITDNTTGIGTLTVFRADSNAAIDLGLVEDVSTQDGSATDSDGTVNKTIVASQVPGAASADTRLDALRSQILALDFEDAGGDLYAILQALDLNPEQAIGRLFTSVDGSGLPQSINVLAMATNDQGQIYAVLNTSGGRDTLVTVNTATGQATTIGVIENSNGVQFRNNITQLTFTPEGQLLAVVNDADGVGTNYSELQGPALGIIELTDSNGNGNITIRRVTTDIAGNTASANLPLQNIDGTLANDFGVATVDNDTARDNSAVLGTIRGDDLRGPLTGEEDIVADLGITLAAGDDMVITLVDSTAGIDPDPAANNGSFAIDLDTVAADTNGDTIVTLNETIAFINDYITGFLLGANTFSLQIAADGTGLILDDGTTLNDANVAPAVPLTSAVDAPGSDLASLLGLAFDDGAAGVDRDGAVNQTLSGRDIRLAADGSDLLTDLGFASNLNRYLSYTLSDGSTGSIDLTAATAVQDVLDAINAVPNLTGVIDSTTQDLSFNGGVTFSERLHSSLQIADTSGGAGTFAIGAGDVDVNGIAVDDNGTIFAVLGDNIADNDRLVTIDPLNLAVTNAASGNALIQLPGNVDTNIENIGFDDSGLLLAYDNVAGSIISIDTTLNTPADASLLDSSIGLNAGVFFDRSGGRYGTTVYAWNLTDDDVNGVPDNAILTASSGFASISGTIDPATGVFTRFRAIDDGTADSLTFHPGLSLPDVDDQGLFAVNAAGELIQLDETDGTLKANLGIITDASNGSPVSLAAVEFDENLQTLVGLDQARGRLVTITLADLTGDGVLDTATATELLRPGSLNPSILSDLAFDPVNNTLNTVINDGQIVSLNASGPDGVDAIQADSFSTVQINGSFENRLVATANTVNRVTATDDFAGIIETNTDIRSFTLTNGNFDGVLNAGGDIGTVSIRRGSMTSGSIEAGQSIRSVSIAGDLDGEITASEIGSVTVRGNADTNAVINAGTLRTLSVTGDFNADLTLDEASNLRFGTIGSNADITIDGDTRGINATRVLTGAQIIVNGELGSLNVNNDFAGFVATTASIGNVNLGSATNALLLAGTNLKTVNIKDNLDNSLISAGVYVGPDGVYNTADDQIYGGVLSRITVRGDVIESAVVAGVLPSIEFGPGIPDDLSAYTGNPALFGAELDEISAVDSAEAGGVLASGIERASFGRVFGAGAGSQQASAIAAAGTIDDLRGVGTELMLTREYTDPHNAPRILGSGFSDLTSLGNDIQLNTTAFIIFSEEVLTSTIVLAQDTNNDGDLLDVDDVRGSIALLDTSGDTIRYLDSGDGIKIEYGRFLNEDGEVNTYVEFVKADGYASGSTTIVPSGSFSDTVILDRSGLRSLLRDTNNDGVKDFGEDPSGAALDGNNSGSEGGGNSIINNISADVAGNFRSVATLGNLNEFLSVNNPAFTLTSQLDSLNDVDIYTFNANTTEFIGVNFRLDDNVPFGAQVGLFFRDDQGTSSTDDDTFELLTNWEYTTNGQYVQGIELTETGQYYIAVSALVADGDYSLSVTRATSDVILLENTPNLLLTSIDYTSNFLGANGNLLGFNEPKQLVYLNFDGGIAENYDSLDGRDITIEAFDASLLDTLLTGLTESIINNVVDDIVEIYSSLPASATLYDGTINPTLNVQRLDVDISEFLSAETGIFFTTLDPELTGLNVPYSEVFVGQTDIGSPGLLGIAQGIDGLNMDKTDRDIVLAENFAGGFAGENTLETIDNYTNAFANVIAHELGHILGHNHSFREPYGFQSFGNFTPDDPDNNPDTVNDGNFSTPHLMSAGPAMIFPDDVVGFQWRFSTSPVFTGEFPVGDIDTVDMLLRSLT